MPQLRRLYPAAIALSSAVCTGSLSAAERFTGGYIGVEGDLLSSVTFERDFDDGFAGEVVEDFVEYEDPTDFLENDDQQEGFASALMYTSHEAGIEEVVPGGSVILGGGMQQDGFYSGIEARYHFGGVDEEFEDDLEESLEFEDGYSISARFGTLLREGNVMLYGSLGYATREVTYEVFEDDENSDSNDHSGFRAGIGLEYRPDYPPIFVRLETSRTDFGDETYEDEDDGNEFDFADIDDLVEHAAHLGVGYRF
ncbi:25 kDa outer-membrane immunogenic protein precursor [Halorhodospira halochloris]|uniref:25 kDa outer-membrane immunogenic protein n=1 Tax=Halorhodospira halochloris TaxID=1052 RepID=A0A0X8X9U5_HALHR|nr:outer membrane beta-barrel protein [Halorhodospira halochloris]BAU58111.1 25 kDa outer-membrane immunogenic protein precursor [Halorhodospira halochloris]